MTISSQKTAGMQALYARLVDTPQLYMAGKGAPIPFGDDVLTVVADLASEDTSKLSIFLYVVGRSSEIHNRPTEVVDSSGTVIFTADFVRDFSRDVSLILAGHK